MIFDIMLLATLATAAPQENTGAVPPTSQVTPPKPAMRQNGLIGASAYPSDALRLRQEGKTVVAIHVSSKGKVSTCAVAESSGSTSLDDASCAFVRRLQFDPARDENGRAVEGDTRFPMKWSLPKN